MPQVLRGQGRHHPSRERNTTISVGRPERVPHTGVVASPMSTTNHRPLPLAPSSSIELHLPKVDGHHALLTHYLPPQRTAPWISPTRPHQDPLAADVAAPTAAKAPHTTQKSPQVAVSAIHCILWWARKRPSAKCQAHLLPEFSSRRWAPEAIGIAASLSANPS